MPVVGLAIFGPVALALSQSSTPIMSLTDVFSRRHEKEALDKHVESH